MATTFGWFTDAGLTSPLVGNLQFNPQVSGSQDKVLYHGSNAVGTNVEATSNPGVDQITVTPLDANPASGQELADIKLALTALGLDSATPGDPIDLGLSQDSGVPNAIPVHIRITDGVGTPGTDTDLSIETNDLTET